MIPSLVGILGLVLVILSTAAVFLTFRAGPLLEPGAEVLWKRLRPRVRGTLVLVMLAIAVVGLHDRIAPASEVLLGLILFLLGVGAGLFSYVAHSPGLGEPAPLGI